MIAKQRLFQEKFIHRHYIVITFSAPSFLLCYLIPIIYCYELLYKALSRVGAGRGVHRVFVRGASSLVIVWIVWLRIMRPYGLFGQDSIFIANKVRGYD